MRNFSKFVVTPVVVLVILMVSNLLSSFIFGILLTIGGNIERVGGGLNKLTFDPMITIAYMMLFYFLTLFFQPSPSAQFYIFLFALFLSFTVPFMQGAIFLVIVYSLLRRARLI